MKHFKSYIILFISVIIVLANGCSKGADPDASTAIPSVSVNLNININSSPYTSLLKVGGVAYASGGYRGLILYRSSTSTIVAFDRACTYDLSNSNAIISAQTNGTDICIDCGSSYDITTGNLLSGPSTMGMKSYKATFTESSGALSVSN